MRNETFCANDFAPRNGKLSVFLKKNDGKLSDGFAAVFDGEVYVIDGGRPQDGEMLRFLLTLRESWLSKAPKEADRKSAALEIHLIASHSHGDHVGALPGILSRPEICVLDLIAPKRSYRSLPGPDLLPLLAEQEERLFGCIPLLSKYRHKAAGVHELPYGKIYPIRFDHSDVTLDVYPAPFDWSENAEAYSYLKETNAANTPFYREHPEVGCANGVLNGNSLWVRIQKGKRVVLITGDQRADDAMLGHMIRFYGEEHFRCDVLKLTHHGTNNYPPDLIRVAQPLVTVFASSPEMATSATKALCEKVSTPYYLKDSNLLITLDGEELEIDAPYTF